MTSPTPTPPTADPQPNGGKPMPAGDPKPTGGKPMPAGDPKK